MLVAPFGHGMMSAKLPAKPKGTVVPDGARLVLKPVGYVVRRSSRADDISIVNGARASFAKHKSELAPEDVRTPEEAESLNADPAWVAGNKGRAAQPGLVYRLLGAGHETPCEQHGILLSVRGAPRQLRNLVPDEIDARDDAGGTISFPWTANFRHAMTLHRRTRRTGDAILAAYGAAVLLRFHEQGVAHGTSAYLRSIGATLAEVQREAAPALASVTVRANPPGEADVLAALREHLGDEAAGLPDARVVEVAFARHPNLLNLWVFTWQLRAIIHVFWDLVRHRKSSPNGESGRYSVLYDEWVQLAPDEVRTQMGNPLSYERGVAPPQHARDFIDDLDSFNRMGVEMYRKHLERGIAREQCSWFETLAKFRTFVWTFRGGGLLNMVGLRNHPTALRELAMYADEMEADLRREAPLLHATLEAHGRKTA